MALIEPGVVWVSIDPGDSHVGFAIWDGETCTAAYETSPAALEQWLEANLPTGGVAGVVLEKFMLYGWSAGPQHGSEFLTSQLIGVVRYLGRKHQVPVVLQQASVAKAIYRTEAGKARKWVSRGHGPHAKDAEAHGVAYLASKRRRAEGFE